MNEGMTTELQSGKAEIAAPHEAIGTNLIDRLERAIHQAGNADNRLGAINDKLYGANPEAVEASEAADPVGLIDMLNRRLDSLHALQANIIDKIDKLENLTG